jgi:hypothetical protein
MVIALLYDIQITAEFLGNFADAGYDLIHVSVIMKSVEDRNKIANDQGPFQKIVLQILPDTLKKYVLTSDDINRYIDGINHDKTLIVIDTYPDESILTFLNDYQPEDLSTI